MNIKSLKNDMERIAFLKDYRNTDNGWSLWKDDGELERRFWMLRLAEDAVLVVEEQLQTFLWPKKHTTWSLMRWYIIEDSTAIFGDCVASRTQALAKLKEVAKR